MLELYKVGGTVRDDLLGVKSHDIDYAVTASSYTELVHWLEEHGYTIFQERPEFGSIRARSPEGEAADFTLCRKDGFYADGRHPESILPGSLYDDLSRRDFTMNAIAVSQEGVVSDPFGGRKDIADRIVRAVGNAQERLEEDALRALRAIRFAVTKDFHIDYDLSWAINNQRVLNKLKLVSVDRMREEVGKMLAANTPKTLEAIAAYPQVFRIVFGKGIWFEPTTKDAPRA